MRARCSGGRKAARDRPSEYLQAGFELFGGHDPAEADAEVFATLAGAAPDLPLRAETGDIGLLSAAVAGLATTPSARKAALLRHLWRPRRFRALLDRFGGRTPRARGPRGAARRRPTPSRAAGPEIGLRVARRGRGAARRAARGRRRAAARGRARSTSSTRSSTSTRPRPPRLRALRAIARDLPAIGRGGGPHGPPARRARGARDRRGALGFEGSFGLTTLEYYDGFVFALSAEGRPDLPPVATGGRYDALTRVLGRGRAVPAVGGVIRPEVVAGAAGDAHDPPARPAVQGAPMEDAFAWFAARGVRLGRAAGARDYAARSDFAGLEPVLLSAGEIPRELEAGRIHLGVTGSDLVREKMADWEARVEELAPMGFGHADVVIAVPRLLGGRGDARRPRRRLRPVPRASTATACGSPPSTTA